jgi:hypothetical protein
MRDRSAYSSRGGARTYRMYEEDGSWFFKTREGGSVGPFRDELETSTRLEVYIRMVDSGLLAEENGLLAGGIVKDTG